MTVKYRVSDPCTDMILDFIAGGVPGNPTGESFGDYNIVIGERAATRDLSHYTLANIDSLMDDLLEDGQPSTAVGRYQIIRNTLHTLTAKAKAPQTTLFTPEFQDSLGWLLLCQRDYRRWWVKQISDERFAHNISCEWASLPDPFMGGKSHYDGVGPNHAGTSLAHVYDMLTKARAAQKRS